METFVFYSVILLWAFQFFFLFCLFLCFRQFGLLFLQTGEGVSRDGIAMGKGIPIFQGESLKSGRNLGTKEVIGQEAVIAFVSPDCKPCLELLPDWNEAVDLYQDQFRFVLFVQGDPAEAKKMIEGNSLKGEVVADPDQQILRRFQVRVTPFGFALDENGVVKEKGLCGGHPHLHRLIASLKEVSQIEASLSQSFNKE